MARVRLTDPAQRDIDSVLAKSQDAFGTVARTRYQALIRAALKDLASNPLRIGSRELDASRPNLRAYHLGNSRTRVANGNVRAPRHFIIYRLTAADEVEVLRVLHDAMDLHRHLP